MKKLMAVLMLLFFTGAMVAPALAEIPKATKIHKHHHHHHKKNSSNKGGDNGNAPANGAVTGR